MTKQKNHTQRNLILPNEPFPLYQLERRTLKWASTPEKARRSMRWMFFIPLIALIILWFVFIVRDAWTSLYFYNWTTNYMSILFIGTMTLLSGILDFAAMVVTFSSLRDEHVLNRWDLLVLAADKEQITRSKHSFARLRIARVLTFNLAIRVAVLIMVLLVITTTGYFLEYGSTIEDMIVYLFDYPVGSLAIVIGSIVVAAFYLLEPIWRVNAITAMGVALSGRISNIALLAPLAFCLIVFMWLLQGIVLAIVSYLMAMIANLISNYFWTMDLVNEEYYDIINWISGIGVLLALLTYLLLAYGFYRIIRGIAYRRIYAKIP